VNLTRRRKLQIVGLNCSNNCAFILLLRDLSDANNDFCEARSDVWKWGGRSGGYLLINLAEGTDEWQSFVATVNEMPIPKVSVYLVKSRLSVCEDSMRRVN